MSIDYDYMALTLSNLSGIPVRLYREDVFQELFYPNRFKPDLAILEETNIFRSQANVSYFLTDQFLLFGLFRVAGEPVSFILGPVAQIGLNKDRAKDILRSIGEPMSRDVELLNYLQAIPSYPLRNFLQILCAFDYFINGEKLSVSDLILEEQEQSAAPSAEALSAENDDETHNHNTYDLEQQMLSDVEHGRSDAIREMMKAPVAGRAGKIAHDALRQQKNLLVCSATLVSRAAIRGGMPTEDAFALSDFYIQQSELLTDYAAVIRLSAQMVLDFTERVERSRSGVIGSLNRAVRDYVLRHISRRITTEELAAYMNLSRTYLCKRFKEETGKSVADYITELRIDEAKRLLAVSRKPLGEIADSLGFSSQSHFQNVFRQTVGITPAEYRRIPD